MNVPLQIKSENWAPLHCSSSLTFRAPTSYASHSHWRDKTPLGLPTSQLWPKELVDSQNTVIAVELCKVILDYKKEANNNFMFKFVLF